MRIDEVPGLVLERVHGDSDLNAWRDGFPVLHARLVERFNGVGRDGARQRRSLRDARRPVTGRRPAAGYRAGEVTPGSRTA